MNETTDTKPGRGARAAAATPEATITSCSIVKRVPRVDPDAERKSRKLGGDYRVIHGRVLVPKPTEAFLNADGTDKPHAEKIEYAIEGDIVRLTDLDAARLLEADVVEPLDAKPSRVGKVWVRPPVTMDFTGMPAMNA